MSDCKIIGYIPEVDLVRFRSGEKIYNIDGDVIADLWNAYIEGHGGNYDICANCDRPEPKHGRWEVVYYDNIPTLAYCNRCDQVLRFTRETETTPNYCPNCGAKMDEVEE